MDIFDLLFGWGGQAMQLTFQYGFILKEEDFLELTDEQYVQFHIKMGETTEDKRFTLEYCPCLGICEQSPAIMINDRTYVNLTPESVREVVRCYIRDEVE